MKQSDNIIFDLRRLDKQDEELYLYDLKKRAKSRKIKNLVVVSKDGSKLDIKGGIWYYNDKGSPTYCCIVVGLGLLFCLNSEYCVIGW